MFQNLGEQGRMMLTPIMPVFLKFGITNIELYELMIL